MRKLKELVNLQAGSPQFRIKETSIGQTYYFYGQENLRADLVGTEEKTTREITTNEEVCIIEEGDLVISLINPICAVVGKSQAGMLLTQNFVKLNPKYPVDKRYLAFLMNEDKSVRRQLISETSSAVNKITINILGNIEIPELPNIEVQRIVGDVYMKQKRLTLLKKQESELEETYIIESMKGIVHNDK